MLDCLLPNVKFLFRLALGLTHDDGWKMPRSLFAGTLGLGFSGVVSVSGILYSALRLSGVLEMSPFLDLAERSTEVSSEGDLGLLLGSLSLPGAGDFVWLLMEDGSRGGKLSVSSFREVHGPLLPFSLI